MYDDLIDATGDISAKELYDRARSDASLEDEIRLTRCRLGLAVAAGDDKAMQTWLALLHALVRIQSGIGEDESELARFLGHVGSDVLAAEREKAREPHDAADGRLVGGH